MSTTTSTGTTTSTSSTADGDARQSRSGRRRAAVAAAVVAVLAAVGLTVGLTSGSHGHDDHSAADVAFAQNMIPHHEQAVEMAGYVPSRSSNAQVRALAAQIEAAQSPEINQMTTWLRDWHQDVPANNSGMTGMAGMDAMSHGGDAHAGMPGMHGMMSDADMASLQQLSGAAFDKQWLSMMTEHHSGAIEMAKTELAQGRFGPAKALAQRIIDGQTAEIATMKQLLAQL